MNTFENKQRILRKQRMLRLRNGKLLKNKNLIKNPQNQENMNFMEKIEKEINQTILKKPSNELNNKQPLNKKLNTFSRSEIQGKQLSVRNSNELPGLINYREEWIL